MSAFNKLLDLLREPTYLELRDCSDSVKIHQLQGKLQLIDELKDLRERVKDSIKNGNRPESEHIQSNW
jgi:hypothetical protein